MSAVSSYHLAQRAISDLKAAVRETIEAGPEAGLTNAQIGRMLGIYAGHEGHEGHISRTVLAMLEAEGVAEQDESNLRWRLKAYAAELPPQVSPLGVPRIQGRHQMPAQRG